MSKLQKLLTNRGYITKGLGKIIAKKNRNVFENLLFSNLGVITEQIDYSKKSEFELVSFSSKKDFPEQILSILSFLRYHGQPLKWHLYSDGSHTKHHTDFLNKHFPFILFYEDNYAKPTYKLRPDLELGRTGLFDFASKSPTGKKLLYYLNHEVTGPTLFLDSDILFYGLANQLGLLNYRNYGWFLPDCIWGSFDAEYLANPRENLYGVNSGFFKMNSNVNAKLGLEYLQSLKGRYTYFPEQTVLHIILHDNHLHALDPRTYRLDNSDEFKFSYNFHRNEIVMRHYVNPVRYKMWQRDWKWHLSIS